MIVFFMVTKEYVIEDLTFTYKGKLIEYPIISYIKSSINLSCSNAFVGLILENNENRYFIFDINYHPELNDKIFEYQFCGQLLMI